MDKTKQRNNMHVKIICFLIAWTLLLVCGILTVMTNETLSFLFQVSIPIQATSRRLCNSPGRICNPVPAMNTLPAPPLNAIFIKSCYSYHNVTSYNTCCRLRDYREQPDKIMMCLRKLTKEMQPKNISQGDDDAMRSTDCRSWVFEGDSHMRYIFVSLVYTFNKTDLKYRFPRRMKSWLNFNLYTKNMRTTVYHEDIEIMVHSLPVCITFLWDPMLQRLPRLMDEWQKNEERKPTLLVLGSGLHFMANRKSVIDYKDYITKISLKLSRLAESAHVIYKLVDHLQRETWLPKRHRSSSNKRYEEENVYMNARNGHVMANY
ncbi:uncharacterized protein [Palaemon carinicauda]|uniref:uncharacterized protein isoform X2 n=1 Tax=Palaemon carinicauda TaxID=392227 RepID=UPI0035B64ABC